MSDPLPTKKAQSCSFNKKQGYRKKPSKLLSLAKRKYENYPGVYKAMKDRWQVYNQTIEYIETEEQKGHVFLVCPKAPIKVRRIEKMRNA